MGHRPTLSTNRFHGSGTAFPSFTFIAVRNSYARRLADRMGPAMHGGGFCLSNATHPPTICIDRIAVRACACPSAAQHTLGLFMYKQHVRSSAPEGRFSHIKQITITDKCLDHRTGNGHSHHAFVGGVIVSSIWSPDAIKKRKRT